jgi:uncharacterized protein YbjT (DUF2867 family)
MTEKKTIAILGATGAQGGGLARAILNDPNGGFAVRAVTRNAQSDKAKELAALGAEVVEANVDDPESLKKAFDGAYGAFCVTFFWDHYSAEKEMEEVEAMAKAAKETGLTHVIWSTLEDTRKFIPLEDNRMPTLQGKYKVPHFDGKGASDKFFTEQGVPTTFLLTTFYWDNLVHFGMGPKKGEDGKITFALPMGDKKLAGIAAEDIGKCAYGIFKKGKELIGKTVGIAGDQTTGKEMAEKLSGALDQDINYFAVPFDMYRGFGFPGADDLANMFQFYHDFEDYFSKSRDLEFSKSVNPELLSFDAWLAKNKDKITIS